MQCADGLRAADSNGKSDPYAKVRVGRHKGQTKAVAKSLDPRWDERLLFPGALADFIEETLTIKVRDKDKGSFDDPLGEVNVRLGALDGLKRGSSRIDFAHQALQPELPAGGRRGSLSGKPAPPPTGTISFTVSWLPDRGGGGGGGRAREQTSAGGPGLDAEALQALVDAPDAPGRPPAAHPPAAGTRKSSLPPRAHQPQAPPGFTWLGLALRSCAIAPMRQCPMPPMRQCLNAPMPNAPMPHCPNAPRDRTSQAPGLGLGLTIDSAQATSRLRAARV